MGGLGVRPPFNIYKDMATVEKTIRPPSYMKDISIYGSGGEKLFLSLEASKFDRKGYKVFDVTEDIGYQYVDVDFVISKNSSIDVLPSIDKVLASKEFEKIEVKVDTRALETGNLPYEFISHGSSGWSVITEADYVYMILCDETDGKIVAKNAMWIDMSKWHEFVKNRRINKKINFIKNESIVDLLCRISDMRDNGVILTEKNINIEIDGNS